MSCGVSVRQRTLFSIVWLGFFSMLYLKGYFAHGIYYVQNLIVLYWRTLLNNWSDHKKILFLSVQLKCTEVYDKSYWVLGEATIFVLVCWRTLLNNWSDHKKLSSCLSNSNAARSMINVIKCLVKQPFSGKFMSAMSNYVALFIFQWFVLLAVNQT